MTPKYIITALWIVVLSATSACGKNSDSSSECAKCDLDTEFCMRYGSDVASEPDTFGCEPWPDACKEAQSCECLENMHESLSSLLQFCLAEGACMFDEEMIILTCPGG